MSHIGIRQVWAVVLVLGVAFPESGCIVGANKVERRNADEFAGSPHIEGCYEAVGNGTWWSGDKPNQVVATLGELLRSGQATTASQGKQVAIRQERDGSLSFLFETDGVLINTVSFANSSEFQETPAFVRIDLKRGPEGVELSEDVELRLAVDKHGNLGVLQRSKTKGMTGVGIPIVPYEVESVTLYSFEHVVGDPRAEPKADFGPSNH